MDVVLREETPQRLPVSTVRIDLSGDREIDALRNAAKEVFETGERDDAALLACGVLIELHALPGEADLEGMAAVRQKQRVVPLVIIKVIVARQAVIAGHFGHQTGDGQVAE